MKKFLISFIVIIFIILGSLYVLGGRIQRLFFSPQTPRSEVRATLRNIETGDIQTITENLKIPWEIAFLPNGEMLVTQRSGDILKIGSNKVIVKIQGVEHVGEGGLLGMALHPEFEKNNWLYLYLTTNQKNGLVNRVERYKFVGDVLSENTVIIDDIPGAQNHDGGRIRFGPDKKLYVTTGDAGQSDRAQDLNFLGGKILRLNDDGSIPDDNPFDNSPVYSFGHRNPQGLAWDSQGNLWSTEHGRSGALSGFDELNLIGPGRNYGWPVIQGDEGREGMEEPIIHSGSDFTWAPAGLVYYNGSLFFSGLRGESIYEFVVSSKKLETHFFEDFGRLRAVVLGPDGFLYVSTSNMDGRGEVRVGDDKIIKINPRVFTSQ